MTSLSEVYEGDEGSLRRLYLGTALFVVGSVMTVVAIVVGTTAVLESFGVGIFAAREIAGVLAGLGVPAVFLGIFTVLPAGTRERIAAAVGAAIAAFGVLLFVSVYPDQWIGASQNPATLPVAAVYFVGAITVFWSLFTAVVNFKVRNDPGGTVTLQRIIDQARGGGSSPGPGSMPATAGKGSVGIGGGIDREAVETTPASDGGATEEVIRTPEPSNDRGQPTGPADDAEMIDPPQSEPDRYCGNCTQFDYVRGESGMEPYCGYFDEVMDDMDPCEHWDPNA